VKKYLLDTNVVSELRKARPHGAVIQWLSDLANEQMCLSAVTFGELQGGIERTRRHDPNKAGEIEAWVEGLVGSYQVLSMDSACFRLYAQFMLGKPDELIEDAMIAATARIHGLIVATRNETDFKPFDVEIFNPFKPAA
jgi:predicted nucleic acid-binding protein